MYGILDSEYSLNTVFAVTCPYGDDAVSFLRGQKLGWIFPQAKTISLPEFDFECLEINGVRIECVKADEKVGVGTFGLAVDWQVESFDKAFIHLTSLGATLYRGPMKIVFCPTEENYLEPKYHRKRVGLNHLAFYASSKETVDQIYETILKPDGVECLYEKRPRGEDNYYAVFFEAPGRIKLEIVFAPDYCAPDHWTNQLSRMRIQKRVTEQSRLIKGYGNIFQYQCIDRERLHMFHIFVELLRKYMATARKSRRRASNREVNCRYPAKFLRLGICHLGSSIF